MTRDQKLKYLQTFFGIIALFTSGVALGRYVQLGYDKPAMTSEAERNTLRIVDGCTITRTIGGDGSFLNFVCAARAKTGMIR